MARTKQTARKNVSTSPRLLGWVPAHVNNWSVHSESVERGHVQSEHVHGVNGSLNEKIREVS